MKTLTILLTLLFIWIDIKFQIRNSILLMELMFLILFYWYVSRYFKLRRQDAEKKKSLKQWKGYQTPKEVKDWRDYRSNVEVVKTKELDYFDKL